MKRIQSIVILLFLWQAGNLHSQSALQMVIKMNDAYAKAKSYSMNVELALFIGTNDVTPIHTYNGEACKSGQLYYSTLMGKTTVCNKECTVFIDDGQKTIVYSKNPDGKSRSKETEDAAMPDTADFGKMAKYSFGTGTATGSRIVVVPTDQTLYKRIEIVINKVNFTMEELVYIYSTNEKFSESLMSTRVRYTDVKLNNEIASSKFSEGIFVTRKGGKLIGIGKYNAYKVVEQTNELPDELK